MGQTKTNLSEILALGVIMALSVIVLGSVIMNKLADDKLQAAEQEIVSTR